MNPEPITAIIVDDEKMPGLLLENMLLKHANVKVLANLQDPADCIQTVADLKPDLIFLDIRMPGLDGFQVLDELRGISGIEPGIVFTSSYDEYALKAFEYAAFDYLLKPVDSERLAEVLARYKRLRAGQFRDKAETLLSTLKKLVFRSHAGIIFVDPEDIMFCQAEGNYSSLFYSPSKKETITLQLGMLESQLRNYHFFRTSRSYLINLAYLRKTDRRKCLLEKDGVTVTCDISYERLQELLRQIQDSPRKNLP